MALQGETMSQEQVPAGKGKVALDVASTEQKAHQDKPYEYAGDLSTSALLLITRAISWQETSFQFLNFSIFPLKWDILDWIPDLSLKQ